jgi:sugar lactone lactonase YvrE
MSVAGGTRARRVFLRAMRSALLIPSLVLAGGCSGSVAGSLGPAPYSAGLAASHPTDAKRYLYLGEARGRGYFRVYDLNDLRLIRKYQEPWGTNAMATDPWGDLYITSSDPSYGQLIAFTPGARSILLHTTINFGSAIAIDPSGNVYVAETFIDEYAARSTKLLRTIKARGAVALAVDKRSNLYAAIANQGTGEVLVFSPGSDKPSRVITKGIDVPTALVLDSSDDIFVANCSPCASSGGRSSVTEYAPGNNTPSRTITKGIDNPSALALGRHGLLFVANDPLLARGFVSVYSSGAEPVRTITKDVDGPDALAVGPNGDLYVGDCRACTGRNGGNVTVYSPDGSQFLRKIADGFDDLNVIAIGGE